MLSIKRNFIISVVTIALIVIVFLTNSKTLPHSFTIHTKGDFTSSAAGRNYEGTITFKNNVAVSGVQTYSADGSTYTYDKNGQTKSWNSFYECRIQDGQWLNTDGKPCEAKLLGGGYLESSRELIQEQIRSGALKPMKECQHLDLCYEIIR